MMRKRWLTWRMLLLCALLTITMSMTFAGAEGFFDWGDGEMPAQEESEAPDLETQIELDFNGEEDAGEKLSFYQPYFEGQDVKLKVTGYDYLPFLTAIGFGSLELDLADEQGTLFDGTTDPYLRAGDIQGLKSLCYGESRGHDAALIGTFSQLEELTARMHGWGVSYLGRMDSEQLPALKTLRLEFADTWDLEDPEFARGLLFPETLETVEVYCEGKIVEPEEINNADLLGGLAVCCPRVNVNGIPLQELLDKKFGSAGENADQGLTETAEGETETSDKEEDGTDRISRADFEAAKADSALYRLYRSAKAGTAPGSDSQAPLSGKLVIATVSEEGIKDHSIAHALAGEDFYGVPSDALAQNIDEAQAVALIEEETELVGYYYAGNAYRTTTNLLVMGPAAGELYSGETVAVNDPPETIETTTTATGSPIPKSGWGEFEVQTAVDILMDRRAQSIAGGEGDAADEGDADRTGMSSAGAVGAPEEEILSRVLDLLGDEGYRTAREVLRSEESVGSGTRGDAGLAVQQLLSDFGCEIAVDGIVGAKTIEALHQVQETFGLPVTDAITPEQYDTLLPLLLLTRDEEAADELLRDVYEEDGEDGRYEYLKGCAYLLQGRFYAAKEAFESSGYGDSQERAASCEQARPQTGEIWHNPEVAGSDSSLKFTVNSADDSQGMCFYMYTDTGTLTSILFVTGSGSATTYVPSGVYRIKAGTGQAWYGRTDAFGRDGNYEFMVFDEEDPEQRYRVTLESGAYELSINVSEIEEDAEGVGSTGVDWDEWV